MICSESVLPLASCPLSKFHVDSRRCSTAVQQPQHLRNLPLYNFVPSHHQRRSCKRPMKRQVLQALDGYLKVDETNYNSETVRSFLHGVGQGRRSFLATFIDVSDKAGAAVDFLAEMSSEADSLDDSVNDDRENEWSLETVGDALAEWRMARTRADQHIVDWGRYHLQVMFVDRTHTIRARLAEGLFARIAAWNGLGLCLYSHSCGVSAKEGDVPSLVLQMEGHRLGLGRHVFSAPSTCFDPSDLDMYDLIVAVDINVRDEILMVAAQQPDCSTLKYDEKVRLLGEFVNYNVMNLLEEDLLEKVQPDLLEARCTFEIPETYMSQYSAWRTMVSAVTICSAGLIQFLMDAYPDNLPDYDPVD